VNRREFIGTGAAAGIAATLTVPTAGAVAATVQGDRPVEYYELRQYHLRFGPMQGRLDAYLRDALVPAARRITGAPVGVFNVGTGPGSPTTYVLITHRSPESIVTLADRLNNDAEYRDKGAAFINATAADPPYTRVESQLFRSFKGMPKLELPFGGEKKPGRVFELRTYESPTEKTGDKKVEMFDVGEIAIFRKTGLAPVFFGQAIIGSNLPQLTYLLVFEDMPARARNWSQFVSDPDWRKLAATPGYGNGEILTTISSAFLNPAGYSDI
jgi:hypothetical protein